MAQITIGCIGLGVMGAPIAARLVRAGFPLQVFDMASDPIRYFSLKTQADIAASPRMMAEMCDVVITVLPSGAAVREVALGRDGLVHGFPQRGVLVDMGTSGAGETKALAAALVPHGIALLDAPACGTPADAKAGKLTIPVGGDNAVIDRLMPVLSALGERILRTGPIGSGNAAAALADHLRAAALLAIGEALLIARHGDITPAALIDLCDSFGALGPAIGETLRRRVLTRSFDSGHTLDTVVRGLDIALGIAREAGLSVRFTALCQELWVAARRDLGSEEDHTAIVRWLEATARTPAADRDADS